MDIHTQRTELFVDAHIRISLINNASNISKNEILIEIVVIYLKDTGNIVSI